MKNRLIDWTDWTGSADVVRKEQQGTTFGWIQWTTKDTDGGGTQLKGYPRGLKISIPRS